MKRFWSRIRSLWAPTSIRLPPQQPYLVVVVPGNYRQFHDWCYKRAWNPNDRRLRCIGQGDAGRKLCGIGPIIKEVRFVGTYRDRKDIAEVFDYVDHYQNTYTNITTYFEPWRN